MPEAEGPAERKIVFLCSAGGGNLRFLHKFIALRALPGWKIAAVIADRGCGALEYSSKAGLPGLLVSYTRKSPDELRAKLTAIDPHVIITNIYKILDSKTVEMFDGRLVNIHYSLLPAFAGMIGDAPVRAARARGCSFTGATCHLVTGDVDAGPILAQAAVPIRADEADNKLLDRVFRAGCLTLANTVARRYRAPNASTPPFTIYEDAIFVPPLTVDVSRLTEEFWLSLR